MYKIKYSYESYLQIDNFINSYKQYFKKLYLDSWLYDEEVIIKNYYYVWDKLYLKIKTKIENIIWEKVIWKHLKDK